MDKREQIEKALEKIFWDSPRISINAGRAASQILAEQAIAIECEVEQAPITIFGEPIENTALISGGEFVGEWWIKRYIGTPGKALAIIISLEGEDVAQGLDS